MRLVQYGIMGSRFTEAELTPQAIGEDVFTSFQFYLLAMKKRLTDIDIWEALWYRKLPPKIKCLWNYIKDRCDNAGVWNADFQLASFQIGEVVNEKDLLFFGDKIKKVGEGKFWLTGFITFQYRELSPKSKPHQEVYRLIEKHKLNIGELMIYETNQSDQVDIPFERPKPDKQSLTKDIFEDEIYCEALLFKSKTIEQLRISWDECFLWHSQDPNASHETYWWRQKLASWITRGQPNKPYEKRKPTHQTNAEGLAVDFIQRRGASKTG